MTADSFAFPLSFAQERLWFLDQMMSGNPVYNLRAAAHFSSPIDRALLERCLNIIVQRHESLRTTFTFRDGVPVQIVSPELHVPVKLTDLQHLPLHERRESALESAREEVRRPFDLRLGPLLRLMLIQMSPRDYILLLTIHHIISDGWSMGLLWRELSNLYVAHTTGQSVPLPELTIQYPDYAVWQRKWLQGQVLESQLNYWKRQLADLPTLAIPTDKTRSATQTFQGAEEAVTLGKDVTNDVHRLAQKEGATDFMVLLAAFKALLYRYTGQQDLVVGTPIAGRNRRELEELIGFFVNSLVMRTRVSGDLSFRELVKRVRTTALEAYAHQDVPFEMLVNHLEVKRDLSRNPLFQVMFQLQNAPTIEQQDDESADFAFRVTKETSIFDLSFSLLESPEGFKGSIEYSSDLFAASTIQRMIAHFDKLLRAAVSDPDAPLSTLPLLTETERRYLLEECNQTSRVAAPVRSLTELFEAQVERAPEATAVIFGAEEVSYGALNRRANQLAHYLRRQGVGREVLVGLMLERSVELVVSVLGVLKAGGAYVPLDPSYPRERLRLMVEEAQLGVLLQNEEGEKTQDWRQYAPVVNLTEVREALERESADNLEDGASLENLAYVIYTSGSTGRPKGVMIEHRGLSNVAEAQCRTLDISPGNRILQFASLCFDASIFEITMALANGATLCLGTQHDLIPGPSLAHLLQSYSVNTVTLPPSALKVLNPFECSFLKTITVAGEACPADLVSQWVNSDCRFFNLYGPTEATIWVSVAECFNTSAKPTIGRPIANTESYVLDEHLNPVPIGIVGELFVSGVGLARGYLERPDLTAERFVPHPFSAVPGARLYRTGDLVRYLSTGDLEYIGRKDHQVKLRGWRIELEEIEAVLKEHPSVTNAVVTVKDDRCIGYVIGRAGVEINIAELREHARAKLPEQMVPSALVKLNEFPRMPSGKIDRLRLPEPEPLHPQSTTSFQAPRTPMEETIATIWKEVLNLHAVGIYDNFFDIGGHSLLLAQAYGKLQGTVKSELSMTDMFRYPTIYALAKYLTAGEREEEHSLKRMQERATKQSEARSQRRRAIGARAR